MGLFRNDVDDFFSYKLWELNEKIEKGNWSYVSKRWALIIVAYSQSEVEMINDIWLNMLNKRKRLDPAFNDIVVYYLFLTLIRGDEDDLFLNYNKISKEVFIGDISEIFGLTISHQNKLDNYLSLYEAGKELSHIEFEDFFDSIRCSAGEENTPLPDQERVYKLEDYFSNRLANSMLFGSLLKNYELIP